MGKLKSLSLSNKKDLVTSKLDSISMTRQCKMVGVSRSSLYYTPKPISDFNLQLLHATDKIYTDNPEYGYRFIHKQLLEDGVKVGRNKVLSSMHKHKLGICAIYPHKKKGTSTKHPEYHIYDYLLKSYWTKNGKIRQVNVDTPNEVWSGDITYIRMNGGFMYLAAVIDWRSRAILSYKLSNSMDASLATGVLQEALAKYPKPKIFTQIKGHNTQVMSIRNCFKSIIVVSMNGKDEVLITLP